MGWYQRRVHGSVSIDEDGTVTAYVLSIVDGSSANELAARLYSPAFRGLLENTTLAIGGQAMEVTVGAVSFKPEAFVAPIPTTTTKFVPPTVTSTATSTGTSTATSTTASPTLGSTVVITEAISTSTSTSTGGATMDTSGGPTGPAWQWLVVGGVAVGGAAAVVLLLFQKARKRADAPALDV